MTTSVTVGHTITMTIGYFDAAGNPPPAGQAPVPDSPPQWSNSAPSVETLAASADGLTCVATVIAAGADTITVTAVVGGKTYTAVLDVSAAAAPFALDHIAINAVVN